MSDLDRARAGRVPEPAEATEVEALSATFASAFANDPMIRWPMPDATPGQLQALFRAILAPYVELGVAWKLQDQPAAAWLPPASAGRAAEIERGTRPAIYGLTSDGGARYSAFWDWLGSHLPAEPCWFLDIIAVRPDTQGRGLGRILVRHGLDLTLADGRPAFLQTGNESNLPFSSPSASGSSTGSRHPATAPRSGSCRRLPP